MSKHLFTYEHMLSVGNDKVVSIDLDGGVDYERDGTLNIYLFNSSNERIPVCNKTGLYAEINLYLVMNECEILSEAYEECLLYKRERDQEVARELQVGV